MTSLFEGETMNFLKNLRIFLFKRRNAYLRYLCYILLSRIQIDASFWVYVILRMSSTSMLTSFRNQGHRQGELARPYDPRTACMPFVLVEFYLHLMPYTWFP